MLGVFSSSPNLLRFLFCTDRSPKWWKRSPTSPSCAPSTWTSCSRWESKKSEHRQRLIGTECPKWSVSKNKKLLQSANYFFLNCPKLVRMERYSRERKETFSGDSNLILCPNLREEFIYKKFVGCTLLEFSAHLKNILESWSWHGHYWSVTHGATTQ